MTIRLYIPTAARRGSFLASIVFMMDKAMAKARRNDLRRRLRSDANMRRDLGMTRFQLLRITDQP